MERHTMRVACATFDRVNWDRNEITRHDQTVCVDPAELWDWITALTCQKERTVLWAHNLGYDLRICCAIPQLLQRGWTLKEFAIDSYRVWMQWGDGRRGLTMVDTMSFVHQKLEVFADGFGDTKLPLPTDNAPLQEWIQRCESDTAILRHLVLRLLSWLRTNDCGDFRLTGAAQASACFRHRFLGEQRALVHTNRDALDAERRSAWTGRCEVWQHGAVKGELYEWDFALAYARIARDVAVPVRYRGCLENVTLPQVRKLSRRYATLSAVTVTTDVPVVPTERGGRIVWPTGTFDTCLWDNELELARRSGATIQVHQVWFYVRGPLLRSWATWIIERLEGENQEHDIVGRRVLKLWARQLIGRFGLRYPRWEIEGETDRPRLDYLPYVEPEYDRTGVFLALGTTLYAQSEKIEGNDSAPAIMAYIMAEARVRLWEAMQDAGLENVVYVDTDSVLVTAQGSANLVSATNNGCHVGLREKGQYNGGVFHAPRQVQIGSETRIAGLPRSATKIADDQYIATVWEGMREALWNRRAESVALHTRQFTLRAHDARREHLDNGRTQAIVL